MKKLIFASLISVGALLAAQTPAAKPAAQTPASSSKTVAKSNKKSAKKHHSKKATAVNSTSAKPAGK